jgi:hypothetical protein
VFVFWNAEDWDNQIYRLKVGGADYRTPVFEAAQ